MVALPRLLFGLVPASLERAGQASAAEIKLLTAGAMRAVVVEMLPEFEKRTGHKVTIDNATAGALAKRIEGGEAFDVAIITPEGARGAGGKGKVRPAAASIWPRSASAWR